MSFRSLLFDHLWLKILSFVLATLIWLAVNANLQNEPMLPKKFGAENTFTFVNRPILVLHDLPEHPPLTVAPPQASVTVRGPAELIQGLKEEDIDVFVRVNDKHPVNAQLPVHVRVPSGASVARVLPLTAFVNSAPTAKPPPNP